MCIRDRPSVVALDFAIPYPAAVVGVFATFDQSKLLIIALVTVPLPKTILEQTHAPVGLENVSVCPAPQLAGIFETKTKSAEFNIDAVPNPKLVRAVAIFDNSLKLFAGLSGENPNLEVISAEVNVLKSESLLLKFVQSLDDK